MAGRAAAPVKAFSKVTVGVGDLDTALSLWVDTFGLQTFAERCGPDSELSRLWAIGADDIRRQALVGTPGQRAGMIHFVEFAQPDPPVRHGASAFDFCPKNLDIYVDDIGRQMGVLRQLGHEFRSENYSEIVASNGARVREIQLPAHDGVNIVLLQLVDDELDFSPRGFSGVGPVVTTVPDADREKRFYRMVLNLRKVSEELLEGPEIEQTIGLPPGCGLDFSVWGHKDAPFGRLEIISYRGATGANLFGRVTPKARGILHVSYHTNELESLIERLEAVRVPYISHGHVSTISSKGIAISFRTPAGFRIEAVQTLTDGHL